MTVNGAATATAAESERLRAVVAATLGLATEALEADVPLSRYGLDSLGAIELSARLAETLGCAVPEWLDPGDATLARLALLLTATPGLGSTAPVDPAADARLPDTIRPDLGAPRSAATGAVLLTGATGFFGAHLLAALLDAAPGRVVCLVRAPDAEAGGRRLRQALARYALPDLMATGRVAVVAGDVAAPRLGLDAGAWERLAASVDAIHHAAAQVNWVAPYGSLRAVNVGGTLELLRLACHGPVKRFHLVSSLAVCYALGGPPRVTEADDLLPRVAALPLGYAQSKCVAEALVRQAGRRGLPATIVRPALLAGDRRAGVSNPDDLLTALFRGCIRMGAAPDLDWKVDCIPVDAVAEAAVRLAATAAAGPPRVFHLGSPAPRHWRECVLWLNLAGYPVRLVPHSEWLARLADESRAPDHPLGKLRGFFLERPAGGAGLTLPELYEETRRSQAASDATDRVLAGLGLRPAPVGPALLDRYVEAYRARDLLPPPSRPHVVARRPARPLRLDPAFFTRALANGGAGPLVSAAERAPNHGDHSILGELASGWGATETGLWRYRLALETEAGRSWRDVVVKVKPRDETTIAVGERLARTVDPRLGDLYARFQDQLGLTGAHRRELAVYAQTDPRFRRHVPAVLGAVEDEAREAWVLVLEDLAGLRLLDAVDEPAAWRRPDIEAALAGIAEVHAIWYRREAALLAQPWLGPAPSAAHTAAMRPWWIALAEHAAPWFAAWAGPDLPGRHRALAEDAARWACPLETLPRTLIHHDFNPRNLALRGGPGAPRLCAFDWELATLGIPQRDLAELLCFVLDPAPARADVARLVEGHRTALAAAAGTGIDADDWWRGLGAALDELLVSRLATYALVSRIRPQRFLPRVVRAWTALRDLCPDL